LGSEIVIGDRAKTADVIIESIKEIVILLIKSRALLYRAENRHFHARMGACQGIRKATVYEVLANSFDHGVGN
jgi:hypothetical protein